MPKRRCRCLRAAGGEVSRAGLAARLQLSARPRGSLGRRTGRVHPGLAGAPLVPRPVGVLALGLLGVPLVAHAQQVVRFGCRVLLATDGPPSLATRAAPPEVDDRLAQFLPRLRQLFRYQEYTSLERYRAEVPVGATQRWPVPGERQLEVTPEGVDGNSVRLRVRLERNGRAEVNTSIQAASGNPAVIGGPKHAD